jgi:hypothetical protein
VILALLQRYRDQQLGLKGETFANLAKGLGCTYYDMQRSWRAATAGGDFDEEAIRNLKWGGGRIP